MRFWEYKTRVYAGATLPEVVAPFKNRVFVSPLLMFYFTSGKWWSYEITLGNRWVLAVTARVTRQECMALRLDFLKLGQLDFMVWWPGA